MRCRDCHNFVLFNPKKGLCLLAKQFLTEEEFKDPRVSCDFWKPYKMATIAKKGKLFYVKADNDNLYNDDAEELGE